MNDNGKPKPPPYGGTGRPWHCVWPSHLPFSLEYPDVPIWWILEKNGDAFADRVAICFLDHDSLAEMQRLTYNDLICRAQSVAAGLQRLKIKKGDRVAVCLPNSPELIISLYGIWRAGAVAVPCNPMFKQHELETQLADARASLLIASADTEGTASAASKKIGIPIVVNSTRGGLHAQDVISFEDLLAEDRHHLNEVPLDPSDDLALLLYTGGTTGPSKAAMLTHRNIVANTIQFARWYAFNPGAETCVSVLPLYHSGGISGALNVPLYSGSTLLLMSRFNPLSVSKAVERFRATRLFGVPTMFIAILNHHEARGCDLSSLNACRTNAAPLPAAVKIAFDELVGHEVLVEGYGLTETSPLTHANPIQRAKAGSIGIPLPDTDATIVDRATGRVMPPGEIGEIVIRGPQVMKGYWMRPEETSTVMIDGWLHTGDVAYIDEDGYFTIVDRLKDMINTAGYKVWPREVEEILYCHTGVKLAAVVGVADDYRGEVVKAFVVPRESADGQLTQEAIIAFCRSRLAAYKVPRAIEFRSDLPVNGAGKVLRRVLRGYSGGK